MLKNNKFWLARLSGLVLLFGCNSSGSSDSAVTGAAIDTPFVTASCDGSREIGSSCGSGATTAFFSVFPSNDAATKNVTRTTTAECEDLKTAIENGSSIGAPLLTSTSEVHCTGSVCTANPTNIWYDGNGHAVASIPTGNYTILVRFSNDETSTTFQASDALLCKHTALDSTTTSSVTVESGAGTTIDPVLTTFRPTPSYSFHCQSDLTGNCTIANFNATSGSAALYPGITCADITTQINTYGQITSAYSFVHTIPATKATNVVNCQSTSRGSDECNVSLSSGVDWEDSAGGTVTQIPFGQYAAVTQLLNVGVKRANGHSRVGPPSINANDVVACTNENLAGRHGADVTQTDEIFGNHSTSDVIDFTLPAKVSPGSLYVGCTSATGCDSGLNGAFSTTLLYGSDVTCSSLTSAFANGQIPHVQPLTGSSGEFACSPSKTGRTPDPCSVQSSTWSGEVAPGAYTAVSIVDRFGDFEFTHGPHVGDMVWCKSVTVSAPDRARSPADIFMQDADVQTIAWKDHPTPALNFTCNDTAVPACGLNMQSQTPFYFTAYNLTCANLIAFAKGDAEFNLEAKLIGVGGQFPGGPRCKEEAKLRMEARFNCESSDSKTPVVETCTLGITPRLDMEYEKDLQACDDRPYGYFRDGGPITVAALVDASMAPAKDQSLPSPSVLFCKQYPTWDASTTSLTLDSSTTTTLTSPQSQKIKDFVRNSEILSR